MQTQTTTLARGEMKTVMFAVFNEKLVEFKAGNYKTQTEFRSDVIATAGARVGKNPNMSDPKCKIRGALSGAYNLAKKAAEASGVLAIGELGRAPEKNNGGRKKAEPAAPVSTEEGQAALQSLLSGGIAAPATNEAPAAEAADTPAADAPAAEAPAGKKGGKKNLRTEAA